MDEEYDVIVLGTGLKECILSGLLSVSGKKVLHIDRNKYYGGESASITPLEDLFQKFGVPMPENTYGRTRDWNVDLIPKFLMANGKLVKLLIHTGVTRYLEFQSVEGSYVYHNKSISKVPATTAEALKFGKWNIRESNNLRQFLNFVMGFNSDDSATWYKSLDPKKVTTKKLFDEFQLSARTISLMGHALALHSEDTYLDQPHEATIHRIRMYADSLARYGKSPYLYPMYGLGELPQGFARLAAIYGGTYMLDKPVDELVMEDGRVVGVRSGDEVARCKQVYCDPSYVKDRVKKVGQVVRGIFLLDHPIPNTANASSVQIILPHDQLQHSSDIYISVVSSTHKVASPGHYIAMVSTTVETDNPEAEIAPGVELLGVYKQKFLYVSDMHVPVDDGIQSQVFVSKSYDASTHFETTSIDVLDLYRRGTGADFDFSQVKNKLEDNE